MSTPSIIQPVINPAVKNKHFGKKSDDKSIIISNTPAVSKPVGRVSITPNTKTIISTRKTGYDPKGAIADMVDNAMEPQVNADNIYVIVDANKQIVIADDGNGMDAKELHEAMRLGSEPNPKAPRKLLGGFGMGMKTAGSSMGTVITVITRKVGHEVVATTYDVIAINKSKKFDIPLGLATKLEKEIFARYTKNAYTGTVVIVSNLDQIKNRNTTTFTAGLRRHLSETFRCYVQDSQILLDGATQILPSTNLYVNSVLVVPSDVMMANAGSTLMYDDTHLIGYDRQGEKTQAAVRVKLYLLPDISGKSQLEEDQNDVRLNMTNQGLYVLRNNRQIVRADMLDIVSKDPNNNRFRGEIYIDGDLDEALALNFQKNSIASREEGVQKQLKEIIHPQFKYIREIIDQERGKRNAQDEELQADTVRILKEINAKAKELGLTGRAKREAREKENTSLIKEIQKKAKKNDPKASKGENPPKAALEIKYMALGADGNIVEYTHKENNGLLMTWNTEHVFFDKFMAKTSTTFETRRAMNILYLSIGLAQGRTLLNGIATDGCETLVSDYNQQISDAVTLLM